VVRAGAGFFYDRSGPAPIWDILRYDGMHQRRYVITGAQPPPPDLSQYPTSIARLDPRVELPTTIQFSAGAERQLSKKTTLAVNFVGVRNTQQFRSRDANAPLPPLFNFRPDPGINVFRQIESAGRASANSLEVDLRGDIVPRLSGVIQYVWRRILTDVGGLNWYPAASYSPSGEWGRADTDRRHRFNLLATLALPYKMNLGLAVDLSTGVPFNITTGGDENADGLSLDRPLNLTRNTGLGPGLATVDARWSRAFRLTRPAKDAGPSLTVALDAFNLFNTPNYPGYVGSLRSPFFGQPVSSLPARRFQASLRFQF
jgi:hypothetical protein